MCVQMYIRCASMCTGWKAHVNGEGSVHVYVDVGIHDRGCIYMYVSVCVDEPMCMSMER